VTSWQQHRESARLPAEAESDPLNNKISNESPIGKAILGHKVGDIVKVEVPAGIMPYEILYIKKSKINKKEG
jgi:transcription elongation factor GreA